MLRWIFVIFPNLFDHISHVYYTLVDDESSEEKSRFIIILTSKKKMKSIEKLKKCRVIINVFFVCVQIFAIMAFHLFNLNYQTQKIEHHFLTSVISWYFCHKITLTKKVSYHDPSQSTEVFRDSKNLPSSFLTHGFLFRNARIFSFFQTVNSIFVTQ